MCCDLPVGAIVDEVNAPMMAKTRRTDWSKNWAQRQRRFHLLLLQRSLHLFRN